MNAPMLASAETLAPMLDWSVSTIRRRDAAGLLPAPRRIGRSVQWDVSEIQRWIEAGCPDRRTWQAMQREGGKR